MAKVYVSENQLKIELGFWESLAALSKDLTIPLSSIQDLNRLNSLSFAELGWRIGGTAIPRTLAYGHFRKNKKRIFAVWKNPQKAAILNLTNQKFDKLVIGLEDSQFEELLSRM